MAGLGPSSTSSSFGRTSLRNASGRRRETEELRYDSDYRLGGASEEEAKRVLADAVDFLAAVRAMFS